MTPHALSRARRDPTCWFEAFGRVEDLVTRAPIRSKVKPLQRRGFDHYRRCQNLCRKHRREDCDCPPSARGVPCRTIWLKGRRSGGSAGNSALVYLHAQNYCARIGQIGTNYRTSHNMLTQVKHYGLHDDFPFWTGHLFETESSTIPWHEWDGQPPNDDNDHDHEDGESSQCGRGILPRSDPNRPATAGRSLPNPDLQPPAFDSAPWEQRLDKIIETKITWSHGSSVELYTAENPEAARSAGLQCFHATEIFRWPTGGAKDAAETLNAMIKTVPKRGFCYIGLEGTANGAQGAGYEIAKSARWPEYATWWKKFESSWPQNLVEVGHELQFVLIFAAWFEDWENQLECTPEEQALIAASLDEHERELIALYQTPGPLGPRLGEEVDTTVWNQLKWRRATIAHECKRNGVDEFKQEYPSNPREAFRASGSPVFDFEGLLALDEMTQQAPKPEWGNLHAPTERSEIDGEPEGWTRGRPSINHQPLAINFPTWLPGPERESMICRWEPPIPGARYLIAIDTKENSEILKGTGKLDHNSVQVWRDAFRGPLPNVGEASRQ